MRGSSARLIGRRIAFMIPILFGIITITFTVTRVIPGDPAYLVAGVQATPEELAAARERLGTNTSLLHQYSHYLIGVVHGDLGTSIFTGRPVLSDLADRLPSTIELIVLALAVALAIGLSLGVWAARRRERGVDRVVRGVSFFFIALPDFWLGLVLLYVFFYVLGWAPGFGQLGVTDAQAPRISGAALLDAILQADWSSAWAALVHAILPVLTLGVIFGGAITRLTRSAMVETLEGDYIRFGQACGLSPRTQTRYALRASLPPILTLSATLFARLIGGVVLVEVVFAWGGAASYGVASILNKDYPAIQGFILVSGVITVVVFLILDLLYAAIDPRVRL
jgi:ABC-type dipeptide/oligopeptide/nickel transport system permease component